MKLDWKQPLRPLFRFWRAEAHVLVFNFHRVVPFDDSKPKTGLHTLSVSDFRKFISYLRSAFHTLPLSELTTRVTRRRLYACITFDDVPTSFLQWAFPLLERESLPVTLFPCTTLTDKGYGWRDMVYFILRHPECHPYLSERILGSFGTPEFERSKTLGFYSWSKQRTISTSKLEDAVLLPTLAYCTDDFHEYVTQHRLYLTWEDLRSLKTNPLVTIGSHGSTHSDFRTLSSADIETDVVEAHQAFVEKLGLEPDSFAIPFGAIDQRVLLSLEKSLPKLGYRWVCWTEGPCSNMLFRKKRLNHLFRIHTSNRLGKTISSSILALTRPVANPTLLIKKANPHGGAVLVSDITEDEYRVIHALVAPNKEHHQMAEYYSYLFHSNPFALAGKPRHLGLRYKGNLEAIASLFHVPFAIRGKQVHGAYFSGWWRLPEVHSPDGTWSMLARAQELLPILGAYSASRFSGRLFEKAGWRRTTVATFEVDPKTGKGSSEYRIEEDFPGDIVPMLSTLNSFLDFSVWRDSAYYSWRYDRYPLMKFVYLLDPGTPPDWYCVVGEKAGTVFLMDFAAWPFDSKEAWMCLLGAVVNYGRALGAKRVSVESGNAIVQHFLYKCGHRKVGSYTNYYYFAPAMLDDAFSKLEENVMTHENRSTGDVFPH